ncbi:MAG: hypothetical protein WAL61_09800 [Acidimicrobiales bacterium]
MAFDGGGANGGIDGVRQFWFLLVGLAGALVMIGVTIAFYTVQNSHQNKGHRLHLSPYLIASILVAVGIAGMVAARLTERPLDGSSDASLLASYRSRFFLWVGVGEVPAFIGLAATVATGHFWLYLVGCVFAVAAYVRIAPTANHLAKDQAQLDRNGNHRSLISALGTMSARRSRR